MSKDTFLPSNFNIAPHRDHLVSCATHEAPWICYCSKLWFKSVCSTKKYPVKNTWLRAVLVQLLLLLISASVSPQYAGFLSATEIALSNSSTLLENKMKMTSKFMNHGKKRKQVCRNLGTGASYMASHAIPAVADHPLAFDFYIAVTNGLISSMFTHI